MRLTLSDAADKSISFVDALETCFETCNIFGDGVVKLALVAVVCSSGTALVVEAATFVHYRVFIVVVGLIFVDFDGLGDLGASHGWC